MGFRVGAYAKVWEISPLSDTATKLRISISRKNKMTGEYEQDFSGYVLCVGSVASRDALRLKEGDRIRIGDCDVSTKYDPEKRVTYTNYKMFSFETADAANTMNAMGAAAPPQPTPAFDPSIPQVGNGEVEAEELPF